MNFFEKQRSALIWAHKTEYVPQFNLHSIYVGFRDRNTRSSKKKKNTLCV